MSEHIDIAIVGAGAAGIGAARRLAGRGLNVHLLEASARVGGRAWTQEIAGLPLDLGCGWLHSAARNSWTQVAREEHIEVDQSKAAWGVQFHDLGFTPAEQSEAWQAFEAWSRRIGDAPPPSDCAADALDPRSRWNTHIRAIAGYISGADLARLSATDYAAYEAASSDDNWRVRTGYGALVARGLPREARLSLATPVDALLLGAQGIELRTPRGVIQARAVILTVSTAVLAGDALELPPALEPWRDAARHLPLGLNEKLFLEITGAAPFEKETHVTGNPRDALTASYYIRPFDFPVVECFFGAERAQRLCDEGLAAGFDFAVEQLVRLFGSDVRRVLRPLVGSNWTRMPRIGGAYSYALPGHADARQRLAQPFDDRVFFAGEATMRADYSTAHGAHDSGVRAANEALASLARR